MRWKELKTWDGEKVKVKAIGNTSVNRWAYGLKIVDETDWDDQGKYQYKDVTGVLCEILEDGSVTKYDIAVTQYITRSGSYFSDYYYQYDPLQVDQLVQKVIPQQIIPKRTIVVFAE